MRGIFDFVDRVNKEYKQIILVCCMFDVFIVVDAQHILFAISCSNLNYGPQ